jgi:hypothetical protein
MRPTARKARTRTTIRSISIEKGGWLVIERRDGGREARRSGGRSRHCIQEQISTSHINSISINISIVFVSSSHPTSLHHISNHIELHYESVEISYHFTLNPAFLPTGLIRGIGHEPDSLFQCVTITPEVCLDRHYRTRPCSLAT